jgi:hypothetical protein
MAPKSHRVVPTLLLAAYALAACTPPTRPPEEVLRPSVPTDFPETFYQDAARAGAKVWRIDPQASQIVVYVYRGGALARLGHNHVISSRDIHGYTLTAQPLRDSRADLYMPATTLRVDDLALREAAGPEFDTEPSQSDIAGTRRNMLGAGILNAERFPFVQLGVRTVVGSGPHTELLSTVTLGGVSRDVSIPATLDITSSRLTVSGTFELRQSDFAIAPFSALGGKLVVKDEVRIMYSLSAEPL